jgi:protein-disulfide isomerase
MKQNRLFLGITVLLGIIIFASFAFYYSQNENQKNAKLEPEETSILVREHSPILGNKDAEVTLVEFLDPECEACRAMYPIVKQILKDYEGKVRLVIRYMPLHGNARYASAALEEAREMGRYEQAMYILFAKQPEWGSHAEPRPDLIPGYLEKIGIPAERLEKEYLFSRHLDKVERDFEDGKALGVQRTPTFFVNGKRLQNLGYEPLQEAIEAELKNY